jgi:hypothetical protein
MVATVKMVILLISRLGRQNGRGTCVYTVNNILYVYTAYPHQRQVEKKSGLSPTQFMFMPRRPSRRVLGNGRGGRFELKRQRDEITAPWSKRSATSWAPSLKEGTTYNVFSFFLSLSLSWGYEEQHDGHTTNQLIEIEQSRQGCLFRDQNGRHGRNSYIQIYS